LIVTSLRGRSDVTIKSDPTLNHLFMVREGKATPAEYERPGKVASSCWTPSLIGLVSS
jgi:hypothetical protein